MVAVLQPEGSLKVANLGDSGVRIIRGGAVVFATEPLQHEFNCPFQLGHEREDSPSDAGMYSVRVEEGDTVVLGSDGLFDNLFDRDIGAVVGVFAGSSIRAAQHTATALATLASKHANDEDYASPFTMEALEQGLDLPWWRKIAGQKLRGGKLDDITVVVAHVVRQNVPHALA